MAATVYTGRKQNFTYTNNTGGNVRVIIYWLYVDQTHGADRLTMRWGTQYQVVGLHMLVIKIGLKVKIGVVVKTFIWEKI